MQQPTVTQAYAMIRYLKKRSAPGDAKRITELQKIIDEGKDKQAARDVETFFAK